MMYASMCTRPDITFSVNRLSQFSINPGEPHWNAVKHVLTYLNTTRTYRLILGGKSSHITLTGSADSDYASDTDSIKSVSGYVFFLGIGAVTWSFKKQASVTTSSCEAEYSSACHASKEAIWLRNLLELLGYKEDSPTRIQSDNMGTISIIKDLSYHARSKHFDVQHHYVREHVHNKDIDFHHIPTSNMITDILTKALPRPAHDKLRKLLGLHSNP
jgi:hypothetical protein